MERVEKGGRHTHSRARTSATATRGRDGTEHGTLPPPSRLQRATALTAAHEGEPRSASQENKQHMITHARIARRGGEDARTHRDSPERAQGEGVRAHGKRRDAADAHEAEAPCSTRRHSRCNPPGSRGEAVGAEYAPTHTRTRTQKHTHKGKSTRAQEGTRGRRAAAAAVQPSKQHRQPH